MDLQGLDPQFKYNIYRCPLPHNPPYPPRRLPGCLQLALIHVRQIKVEPVAEILEIQPSKRAPSSVSAAGAAASCASTDMTMDTASHGGAGVRRRSGAFGRWCAAGDLPMLVRV